VYPDRQKAYEDLRAFAKLNENRLYKLMKTCMDPQTDVKALVKATVSVHIRISGALISMNLISQNEFTRRLDQLSTTILSTMTVLLYRASYRVLNQSSIPTLLKRVQKGLGSTISHIRQAALHAVTLLTFVSKHSPSLYRSHVSELTKAIADEKYEELVGVALQALAGVVMWDQTLAPTDK
jgi:sister-chromatid-cohesion protein PDS5